MQILTYNIQYGTGIDERVDLVRIAHEARGADVIALQEVERGFARSHYQDQPELIAELFPDYHWMYGAGVDIGADTVAKDGVVSRQRRTFGNMVLSRYPIVSSRNHLLPKRGSVSSALSIQRSALECVIELPGRRIRFYSIHLNHTNAAERLEQVTRVLDIHDRAVREGFAFNGDLSGMNMEHDIPDQTVPRDAIFLGDFNMEPDSAEYDAVVGVESDWGGRVTSADGFVDAWTFTGNDLMSGGTCPLADRVARLDYCFVSAGLRDRIRSCRVDDTAKGSDHWPVRVDLDI